MSIKFYPVRLREIKDFLERVFNVRDCYSETLDRSWTEIEWEKRGETEHDRALDALLSYQKIASYAVLNELNILVEFELKFTANRILDEKETVEKGFSRGGLQRVKAVKIIEDEYGISLHSLPSAIDIEDIRDIVNAFKHDDYYGKTYEPRLPWGDIQKRYEPSVEEIEDYIKSVGRFLFALPGERAKLGGNYIRIKKTSYIEQIVKNRRF